MNKANVEISWNGVPAATGTTKTEFDNPFVIGRVDLSKLNSLLGKQFRPTVWIGIPRAEMDKKLYHNVERN